MPVPLEYGPIRRPTSQFALLRTLESLMPVRTLEQFRQWSNTHLQGVFPHGTLVCGIGKIARNGVLVDRLIGINFPWEYLDHIKQADGLLRSPVIDRWCREQRPQLFEPAAEVNAMEPGWLSAFHRHGLHNIAAHGVRNLNSPVLSYFSFSRIPGKLTPYHAYLLELLVPHMHVALVRVLSCQEIQHPQGAASGVALTGREREILDWLQEGKTNRESAN